MTPKEKYINFIVDDLIKNTEEEYRNKSRFPLDRKIVLWFPMPDQGNVYIDNTDVTLPDTVSFNFDEDAEYLMNKYGVPNEMVNDVYEAFWEKYRRILKKKYFS